MLRRGIFSLLFFLLLIDVLPVYAHANLNRSEPNANQRLDESPQEIRLWFTEPLEAQFSKIELYDSQGKKLSLQASKVDEADPGQLILPVENLPEDVYTVAWQVVSQTDGHLTQGSFPFSLGMVSGQAQSISVALSDSIPIPSAVIRWINLVSLALLVGSVAFRVFVWYPAVPKEGYPLVDYRMRLVIWFGWIAAGIASLLVLWLQSSIISGDVLAIITATRFGQLLLMRWGLWLVFGIVLWRAPRPYFSTHIILFVLAALILLTQSLFSHASGASDNNASIVADWMHLLAMGTWVGGLLQLFIVIAPIRKSLPHLSFIVVHFSNMARVSVMILTITGVYAAWLHIGSLEAMLTTSYGQAMLVKLLLFMPLLLIGAINLLLTSRGLRAGQSVWSGRLRLLVFTEIIFTIAILAAVGVMTAIAPARLTMSERQASATQEMKNSFFEMSIIDGMMIHFSIEPGIVGENQFYVELYDETTGAPINDASLIRLRFEAETQNLGESELRPVFDGDGYYVISGSNMSVPDTWRVRMMIQRPDEFDTVIDFEPTIITPTQIQAPVTDLSPSLDLRGLILVLTGGAGMIGSVLALMWTQRIGFNRQIILMVIFLFGSALIFANGLALLKPDLRVQALDEAEISPDMPKSIVTTSSIKYPFVVLADGRVLHFVEDMWQELEIPAPANDIYLQDANRMWIATDKGTYQYSDSSWQLLDSTPVQTLSMTHGYLFALGEGKIFRISAGGIEQDERILELPEGDNPAQQFVMLGNHTHVLLNGNDAFVTSSLGLGWQALNAPAPIDTVAIAQDGNLLAISADALLMWNWANQSWGNSISLPEHQQIFGVEVFNGKIYLLVDGAVYTLEGRTWRAMSVNDSANISDIAFQYPATLWLLDSKNQQLFFSTTGTEWESLGLTID